MAIVRVETLEEAQAIRSGRINKKCGALILDPAHPGEPRYLLEKIITGVPFVGQPIDEVPWKPDPTVILVGDGASEMLAAIEKIAPGFTKLVS